MNGINIITYKIDNMDMNSLRNLGDEIKNAIDTSVIVLASVDKESFLFYNGNYDLVEKGIHAGAIKEVANITGGGGGGRPDMAQAGGKDISKVETALSLVPTIVKTIEINIGHLWLIFIFLLYII